MNIIIGITIESAHADQFEILISGEPVFVTREQMFHAIELGMNPEQNYDIDINTQSVYADLGGEDL